MLRELSVRAPWLDRALCVGRLGLLYTLERTKLCAPENIACHITRSHHPLVSPADVSLLYSHTHAASITNDLWRPPCAPHRPLGRLIAESAPLLLDDGEEDGKLHGYATRSSSPGGTNGRVEQAATFARPQCNRPALVVGLW